ncbi:MAG: aldo/keto reductase [Alphaproteobacteria bacterium]|nr:aldo/keto reductase [Alphaproteobacteria bacterium]
MKERKKQKTIALPSGDLIPALELGMWYLGEDAGAYFKETDLIRQALEIGYRAFDTAEMYGRGGAEEVLGEALSDCREEVFLTSKVSPIFSSYEEIIEACDKSLERLKTDYLDMYLLHWGTYRSRPEEVLEAFIDLKEDGKILDFGVSHFDLADFKEWLSLENAEETAMNQAYFNPCHRQMEKELLPFCQKQKIPLIAYAPQDVCAVAYQNKVVCRIAKNHKTTPRQIVLAWLLAKENVGVLVKALTPEELEDCFASQFILLESEEIDALNATFPLY